MKNNNNIMKTTYIFTGLFVLLAVYLVGYIVLQSKKDINNTYNKRQDILAQKVVRGTIYSNDLKPLAMTKLDENNEEYRYYPYDELFCHIVGSFDKGQYGLELAYNFDLLTANSSIVQEVVAEVNGVKLQGNSIKTTLDINLQEICLNALGDYEGSVVLMDAQTGDILSMVSKPYYNPNDIANIWDDIKNSDNGILINRATQGLYPPGSTFKIFTLGEFIDSHKKSYIDYSYNCEGTIKFADFSMSCSYKKPHGNVNLVNALSNSCNCAFVNMGTMIDAEVLNKYCKDRLFNKELPLEIMYNKSQITLSNSDSEFIKCQTVIGQGETLVTPIHMCMVMSSIVNEGILMKPRLVTEILDSYDNVIKKINAEKYDQLYTVGEADILKKYMREVVTNGTAYRLNDDKIYVYGKTGTAQISTAGKADSWFIGGIELDDNTKYAIAVVLENINENTSPAIVVTKEIINSLDK
ncbi:MAG: penicillin-binding protein 2 [Lachnospiraceae bacterium]|nr:penicillin-binding protein 2 [Lachnospiraceae bacterium]